MMKHFSVMCAAAVVLTATACSNYGASPSGPTAAPVDAMIIEIRGERGAMSFSPDPATVAVGTTVVWHNADSETHRVVFNDGEVDTGNIAAGAYSSATLIAAPGPYHCSIHPSMVGSIGRQTN